MFTLTGQDRCPRCGGSGLDADAKPCPQCKGSGWTTFSRRIEVKIPAGVRDGSRIRIAGEGNPGAGAGPRGDLYLVVSLKAHSRFRREDDNLVEDVEVPYTTLVLGGEAVIPTVKGKVMLKIPAGTANGKQFRLAGLGMPKLKDGGKGRFAGQGARYAAGHQRCAAHGARARAVQRAGRHQSPARGEPRERWGTRHLGAAAEFADVQVGGRGASSETWIAR